MMQTPEKNKLEVVQKFQEDKSEKNEIAKLSVEAAEARYYASFVLKHNFKAGGVNHILRDGMWGQSGDKRTMFLSINLVRLESKGKNAAASAVRVDCKPNPRLRSLAWGYSVSHRRSRNSENHGHYDQGATSSPHRKERRKPLKDHDLPCRCIRRTVSTRPGQAASNDQKSA